MLDFSDLPTDGTRFEQLIREILLRRGVRPRWTGKGPDSGRDLLAEEDLIGAIQNRTRTWLVDCKHFSHSARAVGVGDILDIRDRCARVRAEGFLVAVTTTISSELSRKLDELTQNGNLATEVWDAITIERLLFNHRLYFLAQQFFPQSMSSSKWRIFYTELEQRWIAHYDGYFLYVESRAGIEPPPLSDLEAIIGELKRVPLASGEELRVRGIWHDTPNGPFYSVAADYLVSCESPAGLKPSDLVAFLSNDCVDGGIVNWHIRLQITIPQSDYYSPDDPAFYEKFKRPLFGVLYELGDIEDMASLDQWLNRTPPPIRTFNDQLIWNNNKEKFGYTTLDKSLSIRIDSFKETRGD